MDEVPAKYHCNICSKVLRDARLTVCCGQHYCDSCLKQWSASRNLKKKCPHCLQENFQSFLNKAIIREINEFRVKCTHHQKGCDWVGELCNLEKHINSDDGCGYTLVKCKYFGFSNTFPHNKRMECGEECERRLLAEHEKTCKFRRCQCHFCGHVNTYDAIAGSGSIYLNPVRSPSNHYAVCSQYPVKCPNKCGEEGIKRHDIPSHRDECPLEPLSCPFKNVGCSSMIPRRDMNSHCQTNMQNHLLMMAESHDELLRKNEELTKRVSDLEKNNSRGLFRY